jgi:hypothetical protein
MAILGVDNRTERTREQILSAESWQEIFLELEKLSDNCRHLIVMLGVPMVYTSMKEFIKLLENPITQEVFTKFKALRNQFGMLELEDDGIDHWDCKEHEVEGRSVVEMFQAYAERKGIRVTFLSGDVHLTGLGVILPKTDIQINHSDDLGKITSIPTAIVQIISSAIENTPPSKKAAYFLGKLGEISQEINETTFSKILQVSHNQKIFKIKNLIPKRNFGILQMHGENLNVKIYLETKQAMNSKFLDWTIPPVSRLSRNYIAKSKQLKSRFP